MKKIITAFLIFIMLLLPSYLIHATNWQFVARGAMSTWYIDYDSIEIFPDSTTFLIKSIKPDNRYSLLKYKQLTNGYLACLYIHHFTQFGEYIDTVNYYYPQYMLPPQNSMGQIVQKFLWQKRYNKYL